MKFVITEKQYKLIEKLITESDFETAMDKAQKGDSIVVTQQGKDITFDVIDKFADQITMKHGEETVLTTTNSYRNGKLGLHQLLDGGDTSRMVLKGVESIKIVRNGKTIDSVTSDIGRPEKKQKDIEKGEEKQEELLYSFLYNLRGLNVGDVLKVFSAKISRKGEVDKSTEAVINFKVDGVIRKNEYKLSYIGTKGARDGLYNYLGKWPTIKIGPYSPRLAKGGQSLNLVLKLEDGDKKTSTYIRHVITTEIEKGDTDIEISPEEVLKNPILRKALLRQPSMLRKMLGQKDYEGLIPLMKKLSKYGIVGKDGLTAALQKGRRVKFKFLSDNIGAEPFVLRKGKEYAGRVKDKNTIVITSKNRKNRFYINLHKKDGDTYSAKIRLSKTGEAGEVKEKKYRSKIKIIDYNY